MFRQGVRVQIGAGECRYVVASISYICRYLQPYAFCDCCFYGGACLLFFLFPKYSILCLSCFLPRGHGLNGFEWSICCGAHFVQHE